MFQSVEHAPPQQLLFFENPKDSANISSGFAFYDKDVLGWRKFFQLCNTIEYFEGLTHRPRSCGGNMAAETDEVDTDVSKFALGCFGGCACCGRVAPLTLGRFLHEPPNRHLHFQHGIHKLE
jgi:hypothetical protein